MARAVSAFQMSQGIVKLAGRCPIVSSSTLDPWTALSRCSENSLGGFSVSQKYSPAPIAEFIVQPLAASAAACVP